MKKTKIVKKTEDQEVTTDVICNLCGDSCAVGNWSDQIVDDKSVKGKDSQENEYGGLIETVVHGGFHSNKLEDMASYRFSLCEVCLRGLMNKFKVPVEIKNNYLNDFVSEKDYPKIMEDLQKSIDETYKNKSEKRKSKLSQNSS
jgi:hypothetical protein